MSPQRLLRLIENEIGDPPSTKGFQYPWQVGAGGQEVPFLFNSKWFLYIWNAKERKHYYYDYSNDMFMSEADFEALRSPRAGVSEPPTG